MTLTHWRASLHMNIETQTISTDEYRIRRRIFQGDSLRILWHGLALNPFFTIVTRTEYGLHIIADRYIQKTKTQHALCLPRPTTIQSLQILI